MSWSHSASKPNANQIIASNALAIRALLDKHGAVGKITPIAADSPAELHALWRNVRRGFDSDAGRSLRRRLRYYRANGAGGRVGNAVLSGGDAPRQTDAGGAVSGAADDWAARQSGQRAGLCDGGFGACGAGYAGVCGCEPMPQRLVKSGGAIAANNGGRAHYMRAVVRNDAGAERVFVFERQDSSLLAVMERANCLVVRPAGAGAVAGEPVHVIDF